MDRSDEDGVSSSQTDGDLARAENGLVSQSPANGPPALWWQTVVPAAHRHSPFRLQVEQERFFPSLPPPPFCGYIYSTQAPPFARCQSMGPQITVDAKTLAASKSHCEAERRRRERINGHLARLRSLLPSTTKTDKASLLAEVIEHVKALKRQTSVITGESPLPTEADELTVDAAAEDDGRLVITASLCCDDRPGLLPELIRALKSLRLRALKAEITTLAGRVKNVLVITAVDGGYPYHRQPSVAAVQDLLKSVMERTAPAADDPAAAAGGIKQQRTAA
ncbi:Transcription factor bHLH30 [Apostasia shenzhenica]|uniref:Transcription factor bHLH30 n=1 Tax=Apostasia shenzhenica TaxID=1088818 RepID=A0A2I0A890_9ASPA|nr:Transcription factor bHLH30 [Apostasia shenzhenica]